jgi:hypothetical protein
MTPNTVVNGFDARQHFVWKHGVNKNEFIWEVIQAPLPGRLNRPLFDKSALADINEYTIENIEGDNVYNLVINTINENQSCSLDLKMPMELRNEGKNFPKAHLVFKTSKCQIAEE